MQTSTAADRRSARRGRRRSRLALLPDPIEQARLAGEADRRAREVLAEADAAGAPLLDPLGRRRSPVTLAEYRRGLAPANKGRRFPVEVLTGDEVQALLDALPRKGLTGARNRALVVVLWRGGLRIAEALALRPKDVDLDQGAITVLEGKGAKRRIVGIDGTACRYIAAWVLERDRLDLPVGSPLFCGTIEGVRGRPMGRPYVTEMLKRYARKAGIEKRVHPHGLRHTHAYELSREGIPVYEIQAQLGHEDLAMTARYIDHLSPRERLDRIAGRAWPEVPAHEPVNGGALSSGMLLRASEPPPRARLDPPEPRIRHATRAPAGEGGRRVLEVLGANGGSATQAQLRRALGVTPAALLKHLHRLHESRQIMRTGLDSNRSVIWKLAPPPVVLHPAKEYRQAPRGEGPRRVLDAIEAHGGRASQAELAGLLALAIGTVHSHCLTLEAEGRIEKGGLDKSSSHRGSQIWRVRTAPTRFAPSTGYTMRVTLPARPETR